VTFEWREHAEVGGHGLRAKRIEGFPYRVVYLVQADMVVIVAYAHEKRRPGYWRTRLTR
jgi:mRNA-degrading endonuclease RelE of RelBE toxin-antitoxin system